MKYIVGGLATRTDNGAHNSSNDYTTTTQSGNTTTTTTTYPLGGGDFSRMYMIQQCGEAIGVPDPDPVPHEDHQNCLFELEPEVGF